MSENPYESPSSASEADLPAIEPNATKPEKIPALAHVCCAWPLLMVLIGGLIGGALGGAAYAVNVSIYKSSLPMVAKVLLILTSGFVAFGIWLVIAVAIYAGTQ